MQYTKMLKKQKHGQWPPMAWKAKITKQSLLCGHCQVVHVSKHICKWTYAPLGIFLLLQIRFRRLFLQIVLPLGLFLKTGRERDFRCNYCHQETKESTEHFMMPVISGQTKFILPPWSPIKWISHHCLITFLSSSQIFLKASIFSLQSIVLFSSSSCGRVMGKLDYYWREFKSNSPNSFVLELFESQSQKRFGFFCS